ncbi:MAG: LysR family transcriptional regulator [Burkholderiaceae bacterium]|uniref:LysR family transcriptional regulator n=1 Tax=Herminiimonas contaminans TaxID=1111140 RepID=A0ABS0EV29_9BURK|nr:MULTISPECIES: LysR family transcriptional regulator [Oxalobacteraceae]MBF8178689.1 LysR family transcriptional regulator [Herminiimonas contaminans]MBX9800233.1 LysR family transcriptional regulator [Burkholderiaceae bacterium]
MDGISDLAFFALLVKRGSLAAAAQELGVTPPSVSKRLAALESRLRVRLLNRTTRRISLTPEGEIYLADGARLVTELEALEQRISGGNITAKGLLKVSATFGFGRRHITPQLSVFAREYPDVEVQLHLTDRPVNLVEQGLDADIRFGQLPDARLTARKIADNRRLVCASPTYLKKHGVPLVPRDLQNHNCILLRESDEIYGSWHFSSGSKQETVKVRGTLSANDGECATTWALDGHGIVVRSEWDIAPYLRSGRLRVVLEEWELPTADIYIVFPTKNHLSAKTRALVDFMLKAFENHRRDRTEADKIIW